MEIWKDVEENYRVSNKGNVFSIKNNRLIKKTINAYGYEVASINRKTRYVHHLVAIAFLNHKPGCGKKLIDHINEVKSDNRVENLQLISHRENISKSKTGTSRYTGVGWDSNANKWKSQIQIDGKSIHIGNFDSEIEAYNAYKRRLENHFKGKLD